MFRKFSFLVENGYEMLNSMKTEELKNFLRLGGLKVTGIKRNLSSKSILCYSKQCYLSEESTRSGSPTQRRLF